VICVSEATLKLTAATVPKLTAVAPKNPLPLIVTDVPPIAEPVAGTTELTAGGAPKKNRVLVETALAPLAVIAVTATDPAGSGGVTAVSWVDDWTVTAGDGV
jgi:hypothetical protein